MTFDYRFGKERSNKAETYCCKAEQLDGAHGCLGVEHEE